MVLQPVIASYSGDAYTSIMEYLDDDVLEVIAGIAHAPKRKSEVDANVLAELVEMHVLTERDGFIVLDTSVFLRDDMGRILETVKPLATELAQQVHVVGAEFKDAPPEVTIFLAGIIGLVQGLGSTLMQRKIGVDWKNYSGRYARSKVDFDELCDVYDEFGEDYLNKNIYRGEKHTAVFMGPGGTSFHSLIQPERGSGESMEYARYLKRYLVDAYAMLLKGEIEDEALRHSGEVANLFRQGKQSTSVITQETVIRYGIAVELLIDLTSEFYLEKLDTFDELA